MIFFLLFFLNSQSWKSVCFEKYDEIFVNYMTTLTKFDKTSYQKTLSTYYVVKILLLILYLLYYIPHMYYEGLLI